MSLINLFVAAARAAGWGARPRDYGELRALDDRSSRYRHPPARHPGHVRGLPETTRRGTVEATRAPRRSAPVRRSSPSADAAAADLRGSERTEKGRPSLDKKKAASSERA